MMPDKPECSVIIPAFNEAAGITQLLDKIVQMELHHGFEIIVIDDGSTDQTADIVRKYPVKLISHRTNQGYGASLKTGIRKATGKHVIMLDSDGQHDPAYIPQIAAKLNEYDLVIGERSQCSFQVRGRQSGKKIIRWVGQYLFDQKLPDYNSGLRGFNRQLIMSMLHMMPNGFSFSTTSTMAFIKEGYFIGTIPVVVAERQGRASNVKFIRDGCKTLLLLFRIIMLFNPLKVFFPTSIIVSTIGMIWGIYGYVMFERIANSATIIIVMGMFLFFIGLIADQIAILNRRAS